MSQTPPSKIYSQQSVDQLALQALAAHDEGDAATRDTILRQIDSTEEIIKLIWAACTEDMQTLAARLPTASESSAFYFARHVYQTKERVPDREKRLPLIEDDLRLAASTNPPLLLPKVRYLHQQLLNNQDASALLRDIARFPLSARDAELLAIVLHSGGKADESIALLSRLLQQGSDTHDQQILAATLGWILQQNGQFAMAAQLETMVPPITNSMLQSWQQPLPASATHGPAASIIIPTNIGSKFVYNQAAAPPHDAMIRQTLESLYSQLQAPRDWPVLIYFDEPRDGALAAEATAYKEKLQQVAKDYNAQLECRPGLGLRKNFVDALGKITTPYYILLEHDWTFSQNAPPLPALLETLNQHPDLHVIRYNYNFNHLQRHDFALMPYTTNTGVPLLTGAYYCNNPALVRTDKMRRDWLPLLTDPKYDQHNGGAGGIEEALYVHMLRLIKECGILAVAKAMGCAVIGRPGDAPRAIHNGI